MTKGALLIIFLGAFLSGGPELGAQDLRAARKQFKKAVSGKETARLRTAVAGLVATGEEGALKDLEQAALKVEKRHAKVRKKLISLGGKRAAIWKSIDTQADKGRKISVGSVTQPQKKDLALRAQMRPLYKELDDLEERHRILLSGIGRLIGKLPRDQRRERVLDLAGEIESSRKVAEKVRIIRIFKSLPAEEAREALAELAVRGGDPDVRVAAVDALVARGEAASARVLARALDDESWMVRVAAADGLSRIPSVAGVDPLISALGRVQGRVLDEVQEALEDITGITFFDNQTLWRDWWKKNGKNLEKVMADLGDVASPRHAAAVVQVGSTGFLAGAARILARRGLGPRSSLAEEEAPGQDPSATSDGATADDDVRQLELETVGQVIQSRKRRIRERALARLILEPLRHEKDPRRRADDLTMLGYVRSEAALKILAIYARQGSVRDPRTRKPYAAAPREKLRLAAVEALGHQGRAEAVAVLQEVLDTPAASTEVRMGAVRALRNLRLKASVRTLIRALSDLTGPVQAAAAEALADLTGEDHGTDSLAWRKWWREAREGFKPRGAVVKGDKDEKQEDGKRGGTTFYGIETRSKHLVYIIDVSGSMLTPDADGAQRIQVARKELIQSIRSLPEDATFNIIFYNSTFRVWSKKMVKATKAGKASAVKWAESVQAMGWTNIFDPLEHAFRLAGRGSHDKRYGVVLDTIFFLSDGQPNRGRIIEPAEILKEVRRMNALKKVKIHCVGIGKEHDEGFMRRLAELTGGTYVSRK